MGANRMQTHSEWPSLEDGWSLAMSVSCIAISLQSADGHSVEFCVKQQTLVVDVGHACAAE